jgi:hypothetical protein
MGRHQLRLLRFAIKYSQQWHTYGTDKATVKAINSLERMGLITVDRAMRQFKLNNQRIED